jgi:hypothetical protein
MALDAFRSHTLPPGVGPAEVASLTGPPPN